MAHLKAKATENLFSEQSRGKVNPTQSDRCRRLCELIGCIGKALPSVAPPVPKFAGFNDAFASVPQVKVKKQKREPTPFQHTPTPSPVKVATPRPALSQRVSEDENGAGPSSPVQSVYDDGGDVMMLDFPDIQEAGFVLEEEQTKAEVSLLFLPDHTHSSDVDLFHSCSIISSTIHPFHLSRQLETRLRHYSRLCSGSSVTIQVRHIVSGCFKLVETTAWTWTPF